MERKRIQRMMDLYDKLIYDIWNQTEYMSKEEDEELSQLCKEYHVAGYPEMEDEK